VPIGKSPVENGFDRGSTSDYDAISDSTETGAPEVRTRLLQKILSGMMVVVVPSALFAGDSSRAMLYSGGATRLNGTPPPPSTVIFSGDLVQTATGSVAKINALGSSLIVVSDSLVQFENNAVILEHGGIAVSTLKAMATRTGDLVVTPAATVWTQFDVTNSDGKVRIVARKGDLTIDDGTETTNLAQGQQTTRDESESQKNNKKKKKRTGAAVPAGTQGILDSPWAIGAGAAAVGGLTTWVLLEGGKPVSPVKP
jgi:hypothetical protein